MCPSEPWSGRERKGGEGKRWSPWLVSSSSMHSINRECKTNTHLPQTTQHTKSHISHHVLDRHYRKSEEVDREQAGTRLMVRFEHLWFWPFSCTGRWPHSNPEKILCVQWYYRCIPYRQGSYLSLEYTNSMENSKLFEKKIRNWSVTCANRDFYFYPFKAFMSLI